MGGHKKTKIQRRPSATLAHAIYLWQERRFDEALRFFSDAVRNSPNDLGVLIDAARALGARYQMVRSQTLLTKALRLGSRRPDVLHAVGDTYRMLGRTKEAEVCFRRAIRLADSPASALELAKICERRHALDEAQEWIAQVLRSESQPAAALLVRGRIERRRGEIRQGTNDSSAIGGKLSAGSQDKSRGLGRVMYLARLCGRLCLRMGRQSPVQTAATTK